MRQTVVLWIVAIVVCARPGTAQQTRPAEAVYQNIEVLRGVPASQVEPLMEAFSRALGVECTHCHVPDRWEDDAKPQFAIARNMYRMVKDLNANQLAGLPGIVCWSCHGGATSPSRIPRERWQPLSEDWPADAANASDNRKLTMAVYSASLGVGCEHCHSPDDWTAAGKPAHQMVARMNAMFAVFPRYMPESARTQCWMCHKGTTSPERAPADR